jgi:hypothetical protein
MCTAHDPGVRLRDIAATLGITERSAFGIVTDLTEAGYLVKQRDGRRNRYQIQAHPLVAAAHEPGAQHRRRTRCAGLGRRRQRHPRKIVTLVAPPRSARFHLVCEAHPAPAVGIGVPHRGGQRGGCAVHPGHRPAADRGQVPDDCHHRVEQCPGPGPGNLIGRRVQSNQICAHRRPRRQSQVASSIRTPRALLASRLDQLGDLLADGQTGGQAGGATWDGPGAARRRDGACCRCVRQ